MSCIICGRTNSHCETCHRAHRAIHRPLTLIERLKAWIWRNA